MGTPKSGNIEKSLLYQENVLLFMYLFTMPELFMVQMYTSIEANKMAPILRKIIGKCERVAWQRKKGHFKQCCHSGELNCKKSWRECTVCVHVAHVWHAWYDTGKATSVCYQANGIQVDCHFSKTIEILSNMLQTAAYMYLWLSRNILAQRQSSRLELIC